MTKVTRYFPATTTYSCIALCWCIVVLCSCDSPRIADPEPQAEFVASLRTALRMPTDLTQFDLNDATTFSWTVVHVFRPYTNPEFVNETVGIEITNTLIRHRDEINLLVFMDNERAVLVVNVPRVLCDLLPPPGKRTYAVSADQAVFQVGVNDVGNCRATPADPLPNDSPHANAQHRSPLSSRLSLSFESTIPDPVSLR